MIRRLTPVMVLAGCLPGMPAAAQVRATIDTDTTATVPVQPGFSGVNAEIRWQGLEHGNGKHPIMRESR